jgi:ribosomal protein S20
MPIIKSAIKRMHQNTTHRARNLDVKKNLKDATKAFRAKPSSAALSKAQSQLDIAVKKNLLKTGTAARRKSQLAREAKAAGVKLSTVKKKSVAQKAAPKKAPAKATAAKKPAAKKKSVTKE